MAALRCYFALSLACMLLIAAGSGCGGKGGDKKQAGKKPADLGVPVNAKLVVEKRGGFAYIAPQAGTAYIVDQRSKRVVFSSAMNFRDQLFFDPVKKRIVSGGKIISRDDLKSDHVHVLYFAGG